MAKDKPADKPPKRDKPTKAKTKTHVKKYWLATSVNTALDKHAEVTPGLLELHKVTPDEWRNAGGTVE